MPLVDLRVKRNILSWGVPLVARQTSDRDGVKSLRQHLLQSILGKSTAVQQQWNGSPNSLVEPFALALSSRVVGGGRDEGNAVSGEVSPRFLTDKT